MSSNENGGGSSPAKVLNPDLPLAPDGSVDIDRIRLRLLIICRAKPQLDTIANYLNRRGWETVVTRDTKDAFKILATFKPDYVLMSVNVPNPKIAQLPTVISQTFKTPVITFGESLNTKTMKALQTIMSTFTMPGAISGPSVHRRIKQILQDIYKPHKEVAAPAAEVDEGPGTVVIQGKKPKKISATQTSVSKDQTAGDNGDVTMHEQTATKKGGVYIAKGEKKDVGGVAYRPKQNDDDDDPSARSGGEKRGSIKRRNQQQENTDTNNFDNLESDESEHATGENVEMPREEIDDIDFEKLAKEYGQQTAEGEPDGDEVADAIIAETAESQIGEFAAAATAAAEANPADSSAAEAKPVTTINTATASIGANLTSKNDNAKSDNAFENKIAEIEKASLAPVFNNINESSLTPLANDKRNSTKDVIEALRQIAYESSLPIENKDRENKTLEEWTVITLSQPEQKIYLLVYISGSVHDEIQFISRFTTKLKADLSQAIGETNIDVPYRITLEKGRDEIVSDTQTNLYRTFSIESGRGVVDVVVMYSASSAVDVDEKVKGDMAQIKATDLVPRAPAGVDIYLHLPKNNKHYLYLKPRAYIGEDQKKRLIEGAAKLYINKKDAAQFKEAVTRNKTIEQILIAKKKPEAA